MRTRSGLLAAALPLAAALLASACSSSSSPASASGAGGAPVTKITAIGAENEYADVIAQVGGKYVQASSIMSNPNTDPHTFEASPAVARDSTPNPHLWYRPATMPAVAGAVAASLAQIDPAHAAYYKANAASFTASLAAWNKALAAFKSAHGGTPVATTEPVADYMLQAAGADNLTPWTFQADIMNGTDPSPQDVAAQKALFTQHKVTVFLYNQQVTDALTESYIKLADENGIPVVGVYETMPTPGYDYQSWMLAAVNALNKAVTSKVSTAKL